MPPPGPPVAQAGLNGVVVGRLDLAGRPGAQHRVLPGLALVAQTFQVTTWTVVSMSVPYDRGGMSSLMAPSSALSFPRRRLSCLYRRPLR